MVFNWMSEQKDYSLLPNSSTFNMMLLVYGSMKEYQVAHEMFNKMVESWWKLNDQKYTETYEEVLSRIKKKDIYVRASSSSYSAQFTKSLTGKDSDIDKYLVYFQKDQPNVGDLYSLKHSSDILY